MGTKKSTQVQLFSDYGVPRHCSWAWRLVLNRRKHAKKSNSEWRTWLWHDMWYSISPLIKYDQAVQYIDIPCNTKVVALINNDYLDSKPAGVFTHKIAYEALKRRKPKIRWHSMVWGEWATPEHSFLSQQVCADLLHTQDRLIKKNVSNHSKCCLLDKENNIHLFRLSVI